MVAQVAIAERVEDRLRRLAMMDDDPEALGAEAVARRHASGDREGGYRRSDGVAGDASKPHGPTREPNRFERGAGAFRPWEIVARKARWPGLVSNAAAGPVSAADVIAFIETVCFVPEGKFVGQPLRLQPWQKDILRAIYDNPHGTRRAIITLGRKNAKTTLAACLLLAHLCGLPAGTGRTRSYIRPLNRATRPA